MAWSGVLPDLDGAGVVLDLANRALSRPETMYYFEWHHRLLHGIPGALLIAGGVAAFAKRKVRTLALAFAAVHLHLVCDLVGSRGPGPDDFWPIGYLEPFSRALTFEWAGQWTLNAWPNILFTLVLLAFAFWSAARRGYSPVELFGGRAETAFVDTVKARARTLGWAALVVLALLTTAPLRADPEGERLVAAARRQVGVTVRYDGKYARLAFPRGDVPRDRGVCTDVVVRAFRDAWNVDLQVLVNEDMKKAFAKYPAIWGLSRPDRNIDHRRVPNLATFFARHGRALRGERRTGAYEPGDAVTFRLPSGLPHIGLVSDARSASGTPLVIHNVGAGAVEEDVLFEYVLTGHYRYRPSRPGP